MPSEIPRARPQTARCPMCGIVFQAEFEGVHLCRSCYVARHLGEGIGDTRVPTLDANDGLARPTKKRQARSPYLDYRFPVPKKTPPPVKNLWQRLSDALEEDPSP